MENVIVVDNLPIVAPEKVRPLAPWPSHLLARNIILCAVSLEREGGSRTGGGITRSGPC